MGKEGGRDQTSEAGSTAKLQISKEYQFFCAEPHCEFFNNRFIVASK